MPTFFERVRDTVSPGAMFQILGVALVVFCCCASCGGCLLWPKNAGEVASDLFTKIAKEQEIRWDADFELTLPPLSSEEQKVVSTMRLSEWKTLPVEQRRRIVLDAAAKFPDEREDAARCDFYFRYCDICCELEMLRPYPVSFACICAGAEFNTRQLHRKIK